MNTYFVVFLGAALLAVVLTPLVVHFARRMNILDDPGLRKVHAAAIPRLGGIAIVVPTMSMILPAFVLPNDIGDLFRLSSTPLLAFLGTALLVFAVGLIDDIWGLSARMKFLGQFLAAGIMCACGVVIDTIVLSRELQISTGWFAIPFTMLWIVGITNAVNLIDGLDGLASGISLITCTVITAVAIYSNRPVMALIMLAMSGSLVGFLVFNFNPARIFLGDCGSLFLGYTLATSSVLTNHKTSTALALALPILALGVPIFDTLLSMTRRVLQGRSPFSADREHIHHRLLALGLPHRKAVLMLYGVTIIASLIGLAMMFVQDVGQVLLFGAAIMGLVVFFRISGALPVREVARIVRRNQAISREVNEGRSLLDVARLRLAEAQCFDDWWRALTDGATALRFSSLTLVPIGTQVIPARSWVAPGHEPAQGRVVRTALVLNDEKAQPLAQIEFVIAHGRSFESVGRRAALFGRLLDESRVIAFVRGPDQPVSVVPIAARLTKTR